MRRARNFRPSRLAALLLASVALMAGTGATHLAHADRVTELSAQATTSSSDKQRLAAVTALARLGDKRALKALVGALSDPQARIRAVAATGLGRLAHKAALPALKATATDDLDADVRAHARAAATDVAKANRLPSPFGAEVPVATIATTASRRGGGRAGFGNQPRALEPRPELFVHVNSTTDDSPGRTDARARKVHADVLRATLEAQCKTSPAVTMVAADAKRLGLTSRHIDVSVTKLEVAQAGAVIEIDAQLRLAISDDQGKMLSFLSGGAKVQVPKKTFKAQYLPALRKEALDNAMRGMFDKLLAHMRDRSAS